MDARSMEALKSDPALLPVALNVAPGREYANDRRRFQGIPGIERAANGRLWATWYAGGPEESGEGPGNYVVVATSRDDGETWSRPKLVIDPPGEVRAFDPALWHDPDGRLWLFWSQSFGHYDGRTGVWCATTDDSTNEDPVWSEPRRLANGIALNKPIVRSNGEWLLPVAMWHMKPSSNIPEEHRHHLEDEWGSAVWASDDNGETWSLRGRAVVPESRCDEHMIVERRDGSLWMLVRTRYGIGESDSSDGGRTWSPSAPSRIPHVVSRFFVRRLSSGRLLLVRHDPGEGRFAEPDKHSGVRSELTAFVSDDDGMTWHGGLKLDARSGVSYPDGVQAPDGRIYIIYDRNRQSDREILMAVFTEEDVIQGSPVSATARLRVVVDKASFNDADVAVPEAEG